jgi:hypothetical protein
LVDSARVTNRPIAAFSLSLEDTSEVTEHLHRHALTAFHRDHDLLGCQFLILEIDQSVDASVGTLLSTAEGLRINQGTGPILEFILVTIR